MGGTSIYGWQGGLIDVLQVASPVLVLTYYSVASVAATFKKSNDDDDGTDGHPSRQSKMMQLVYICTAGIALLYLGEATLLAHEDYLFPIASNDNVAFALFATLTWTILLLSLMDAPPENIPVLYGGSWAAAFVLDLALLLLKLQPSHLSHSSFIARTVLQAVRLALLSLLIAGVLGPKYMPRLEKASDEEVAPLLISSVHDHETSEESTMTGNGYGSLNRVANGRIDSSVDHVKQAAEVNDKDDKSETKKKQKKQKKPKEEDDGKYKWVPNKMTKNWWEYVKAYRVFLPYMWPQTLLLQLRFPGLACCIIAERLLNIVLPLTLGRIVDDLGVLQGKAVPWIPITLFMGLQILNSAAGLQFLESWLWLALDKSAQLRLQTAAYNHVMNLSCDFHDSKRSGVMWQTLSRGNSITGLYHILSLELFPMLADLILAISIFWWIFDAYMACIVAFVVFMFLWTSKKAVGLKTARQREWIERYEDQMQQITESSSNWTTVSYFNRIKYEMGRFGEAVRKTQDASIRQQILAYIISAVRSSILNVGLFAGCFLAAYQIVYGNRKVGDFVVLLTYWRQLTGPLHYFAHGFQRVIQYLVDAEKLLDIMKKEPTVKDKPDAAALVLHSGEVEFKDVSFSYDGKRQVTNKVSLHAAPGQTIALVGETGGGKSTIIKLLFRFYNVTGGSILIDGQDITQVSLDSLRASMGVVPQDPVLFNLTIMENLRYANLEASDNDIREACKAVALHEKVMSFTKGYEELVGERGVKLSGGELQRMAIARAILMNPKILLLDEATSAVDSETESQIQASLKSLCAGRTTFVVAHRLSTIVHADQVLVVNDGQIVECGTHKDLVKAKGHYYKLWAKQLKLQSAGVRAESKSRSRSPAKAAPVLIADVSSGDEGKKVLKQNIPGANLQLEVIAKADRAQQANEKADQEQSERGRSPVRAFAGSLMRRLSRGDSLDKAISQTLSHSALKADAPEFVPSPLNAGTKPRPTLNGEHSHGEAHDGSHENDGSVDSMAPMAPATSYSLPTMPEENKPRLWRRKSGSPKKVASTPETTENVEPKPRRHTFLSPRRKNTQSEPHNEADVAQIDGAGSADSGSKSRVVSAPVQRFPANVKVGSSKSSGNHDLDTDAASDANSSELGGDGMKSPYIKAPANTPAKQPSEDVDSARTVRDKDGEVRMRGQTPYDSANRKGKGGGKPGNGLWIQGEQ